jgi:hypothetical protein
MLVNGIQLCVRRSLENLEEEEIRPYQEILESLTKKMIKSEMEDFELVSHKTTIWMCSLLDKRRLKVI